MFCCCLCCGKKQMNAKQPDFVRSFTKWLPTVGKAQKVGEQDVDPIPGLIKLYSCDRVAMDELSLCRINPNLKSSQRRDLEFYIPQLCSLYLQGYFPRQDELTNFILSAS